MYINFYVYVAHRIFILILIPTRNFNTYQNTNMYIYVLLNYIPIKVNN